MSTMAATSRPQFRRLSPEEMVAKQAHDECYHCTEKFVPGHKCAGKGVFLLELEDDQDIDAVAEELDISMHALTSLNVANTMQLQVRIAGETLVVLVDSGSTHTFVHDDVARRLDLSLTPRPGLSVKVANDDQIQSSGVCYNTEVHIDDETFHLNCYALPLAGFDVVLGVQWLCLLGYILWDFIGLTMSFLYNHKTVTFTGVGGDA